jgi:predicted transcriptional regulator
MSQVIIFTNEDGGVSVCVPTGELPIEQVLEKDCPASAIIVNVDSLPADSTFRNAWELVDGQIVVNENKKQAIIDAQTAVTNVKESALAKLAALGLTQDEVKALVG